MALNETYHSFLMDYASGALDEAHSLIIATHIALSPNARRIVHEYESVGGGLLHECCSPVAMTQNALQSVMDRLDCLAEDCAEECDGYDCAEADILPDCLQKYIAPENGALPWKKVYPGLKSIVLQTSCQKSKAEMMRLDHGAFTPEHTHEGYELTLILDGALHDCGQIYSRGDIIIHDDTVTHKPLVDKHLGCICLIVTTAPLHFTGFSGKVLRFFGK